MTSHMSPWVNSLEQRVVRHDTLIHDIGTKQGEMNRQLGTVFVRLKHLEQQGSPRRLRVREVIQSIITLLQALGIISALFLAWVFKDVGLLKLAF